MAKNNFKDFLLKKGDRLGLGSALVIMMAAIGIGASEVPWKESPTVTSEWIQEKASTINEGLKTKEARILPPLDLVLTKDHNTDRVNPADYVATIPNFDWNGLESNKRLNPTLLSPVEFQADLVRGQFRVIMLNVAGKEVRLGVLIPNNDKGKDLSPQQKMYQEWMRQRMAMMQGMMGGMMMPGGPGMMQPGMGMIGEEGKAPQIDWKLDWADVNRIPAGAKLAETVSPRRMVIVTGSFPYREQLEIYRRSLRQLQIEDLAKNKEESMLPQFLGFNVRRRALAPNGDVREEWRELDLEKEYKPLLQTSVGTEIDSIDMRKLSFPGLVMARPILARGTYPEPKLGTLAKTLRILGNKVVTVELTPLERRIGGGNVDIFKPIAAVGEADMKGPMPMEKAKDNDNKEIILPEYCLVRFLDVTVKPGFTYEYQVQLRATNPNFNKKSEVAYPKLAEYRELTSPWAPAEKPISISLPRETYSYAFEMDDKALIAKMKADPSFRDAPLIQVHRWLETTTLNPDQARSVVPVGEWVIGEMPVKSGEYIGRIENVEVPIWIPHKEGYGFAAPMAAAVKTGLLTPRPQSKGIPINFITDDLLVDYEGGKIYQTFRLGEKATKDVREMSNVEMLILAPDGKLRVRNSRADSTDPERLERATEWDKWRSEVRQNAGKQGAGNKAKDPFDKK